MPYILFFNYSDGSTEKFYYKTREEAEKAGAGMMTALGTQASGYYIRHV